MIARNRTRQTFAAALLLPSIAAAQLTVHVVDDDAGPGVDFSDIATALASPSVVDGDIVLVQDGTYGPFAIDGLGVTVIAELAADVVIDGTVEVRNVQPAQNVLVRGLATGVASGRGLVVEDCAGSVWIEDCAFVGQDGSDYLVPSHPNGWKGGEVVSSNNVVLSRSTFVGGEGGSYAEWETLGGFGAIGLDVSISTAYLAGVQATGGQGGSATGDLAGFGWRGGNGLNVGGATVFASGSTFQGGQGGYGGSDWTWKGCGSGGDGGNGVILVAGTLFDHDTAFVAGAGGFGGAYGCSSGFDGLTIATPGGTLVDVTGDAHTFDFPSPAREDSLVAIQASGHPGDLAFALLDYAPGFFAAPTLGGVLATGFAPVLYPLAAIPPGGSLSWGLSLGTVVAPGEGAVVWAQGGFFNPVTAELALGEPTAIVILNGALF